jgi:hypothetical protein
MAATTVGISTLVSEEYPKQGDFPIAANTIIYGGSIVVRDASGRAAQPAAGFPAMGIATNTFDNRTAAESGGAAGALDANVKYGVAWVKYSGTAPMPGEKVYVLDNQTVTLTASTNGLAGACVAAARMIEGAMKVGVAMGPHVIAALT